MAQPLTDAIQALTRYANETTGASDQTLSDAVETLVEGYGQGGGGSVSQDAEGYIVLPADGGGDDTPILPNEYVRLLCLTSSGSTQYIDTGLTTKANSAFYLYCAKAASSGTQNFFGNNFSTCASFIQLSGTNMYYQFGSVAYSYFTVQNAFGEMFSLKLDANGIYGKNVATGEYDLIASIEGTTVSEDNSATNLLFARRRSGNSPQISQVTIYRFIAEEGGEKVRDMYPAMRKADGELGMYDVVNDVFYTNQGTGTFIKGAMI